MNYLLRAEFSTEAYSKISFHVQSVVWTFTIFCSALKLYPFKSALCHFRMVYIFEKVSESFLKLMSKAKRQGLWIYLTGTKSEVWSCNFREMGKCIRTNQLLYLAYRLFGKNNLSFAVILENLKWLFYVCFYDLFRFIYIKTMKDSLPISFRDVNF